MAASEKKGVSVVSRGKTLLRNVIRHTDWHNRMLEEADMWNQYAKTKKGVLNEAEMDGQNGRNEKYECRSKNGRRNEPYKDNSDVQKSFLYDDREPVSSASNSSYNNHLRRPMRSAHMDVGHGNDGVNGTRTGTNDRQNNGDTTFWMRQLYKAEEGDKDRWGHTGFKELYPQVFQSDRSDTGSEDSSSDSSSSSSSSSDNEEESSSRSSSRKRRKRKMASTASTRGTSSSRKKKKKKRKEEKIKEDRDGRVGKEKKKRGNKDSGRGGSGSSSDDEEEEERRKKRRKDLDSSDRRNKIKRKRKKRRDGNSCDEREERKKKSRKSAMKVKERDRKSKKRKKLKR